MRKEKKEKINIDNDVPDESCRCMEHIGGEDLMTERHLLMNNNNTSLLYSAADL